MFFFFFFFFEYLSFYEEIKKRGEIAGGFPARKIGSRENFARKKKKEKEKEKKDANVTGNHLS